MRLQSYIDPAQWAFANREYARIIQKAEKGAIHDIGIKARDNVRDMISQAGFGLRWSNSFKVRFGNNDGSLYNPFALIHSTISYAGIFETGGTIGGKPFLWLPTDNVPSITGRPHMTPKQFVQLVGPLVTMRRSDGAPMLGRSIRVPRPQASRRSFGRAALRRGRAFVKPRSDEITITIPMFVGVSAATIPKKWDVHGTVVDAANELPQAYEANLEKYDGGA